VARFARQIAGQGYIVAAPSSYHEFTGPEPLAYDVPGTDAGNEWKIKKVSIFFLPTLLSVFEFHTAPFICPFLSLARCFGIYDTMVL